MSLQITFLGTGTSQGVPVIACDCEVCLSENPKDKRLRSSILIEANGKAFVVDTGPDFRQQMLRENVQQLDAVLFTHEHKDHTAGLDDVRAFNFKQKQHMDLYVDANVESCLKREYQYVFSGVQYPGIPQLNLNVIRDDENSINVQGVTINLIRLLHYKLPVLGFRIGDFAYCTDTNYISDEEKAKLKNLKVLVLTALRIEKHISHFSLSEALAVIEELQPEKAYLIHMSHLIGTHDNVTKQLPKNVELAYDGLKLNF
jgi:phosphoribosyl 1,2-cyclic phosphate phosphodiesterase